MSTFRLLTVAVCAASIGGSACRKSAPDERVTTKDRSPRTSAATTTIGGGTSGSVPPGSSGAGGSTGTIDVSGPSAGGSIGSIPPSAAGGASGVDTGAVQSRCGSPPRVEPEPFSKRKLLESVALCAMFRYCAFAEAAERLRDSTRSYAALPNEPNASVAKQAFLDALGDWQRAEPFRFGPAAPQPEGRDLRDRIYSWPRDVSCKVDEQLVSRFYATELFYGAPHESFVTGRSLAALEYLLFYQGAQNGCTQYSSINANGTWASLSASELVARRAEYAAAAAEDLLRSANLLLEAWDPQRGNFYGRFVAPGSADSAYPDEQSALNAVNYGLFYLDKEVKDYKLAIPMGLSLDCPSTSCPERVESRYARGTVQGLANRHLTGNMAAFRELFVGCGEPTDGLGFDDWLRSVGASGLAERMVQAIAAAESATHALQLPLEDAIVSQPDRVMGLYDAVKAITDPLKSEFLSILNLQVPKDAETDND
jgi:uncharacterized protein